MVGKRVKSAGTRGGTQHKSGDEGDDRLRYATSALKDLLASEDATSHAKASAARTLAEMAGGIGRHQLAPLDRAQEARVSLLKRDELERELARLRTICAGDKPLSP